MIFWCVRIPWTITSDRLCIAMVWISPSHYFLFCTSLVVLWLAQLIPDLPEIEDFLRCHDSTKKLCDLLDLVDWTWGPWLLIQPTSHCPTVLLDLSNNLSSRRLLCTTLPSDHNSLCLLCDMGFDMPNNDVLIAQLFEKTCACTSVMSFLKDRSVSQKEISS